MVLSDDDVIKVGPTSVGHNLLNDSQCCGGQVLTASDVAVKSGMIEGLGEAEKVKLGDKDAERILEKIRLMLEQNVDRIKVRDWLQSPVINVTLLKF